MKAPEDSPVRLRVRVQPRASKNEIAGWEAGVLRVRLTAPPVEGAANKACAEFLADRLGVRRYQVRLVSGEKSREKTFDVEGLTGEELHSRLSDVPLQTSEDNKVSRG